MNIIGPIVIFVSVLSFYIVSIGSIIANRAAVTPISGFSLYGGLIALIVISGASWVTALVLFLVGMNRLSQYYKEPAIINNPIKALIIQVITVAAFLAIHFTIMFYFFGSALGGSFRPSNVPTYLFSLLAVYAVIVVVFLAVAVYCGLLYKRTFDKLAEKSNVDTFNTVGLLYLIGSVIPVVGWIAWIFAALGYRKLYPKQITSSPTPSTEARKRCANCGAENPSDALYCVHCGRQL